MAVYGKFREAWDPTKRKAKVSKNNTLELTGAANSRLLFWMKAGNLSDTTLEGPKALLSTGLGNLPLTVHKDSIAPSLVNIDASRFKPKGIKFHRDGATGNRSYVESAKDATLLTADMIAGRDDERQHDTFISFWVKVDQFNFGGSTGHNIGGFYRSSDGSQTDQETGDPGMDSDAGYTNDLFPAILFNITTSGTISILFRQKDSALKRQHYESNAGGKKLTAGKWCHVTFVIKRIDDELGSAGSNDYGSMVDIYIDGVNTGIPTHSSTIATQDYFGTDSLELIIGNQEFGYDAGGNLNNRAEDDSADGFEGAIGELIIFTQAATEHASAAAGVENTDGKNRREMAKFIYEAQKDGVYALHSGIHSSSPRLEQMDLDNDTAYPPNFSMPIYTKFSRNSHFGFDVDNADGDGIESTGVEAGTIPDVRTSRRSESRFKEGYNSAELWKEKASQYHIRSTVAPSGGTAASMKVLIGSSTSSGDMPMSGETFQIITNGMQLLVTFNHGGVNDATFQSTLTVNQVDLEINIATEDTSTKIATRIRDALVSLESAAVNGVSLSGYTVPAITNEGQARYVHLESDNNGPAYNFTVSETGVFIQIFSYPGVFSGTTETSAIMPHLRLNPADTILTNGNWYSDARSEFFSEDLNASTGFVVTGETSDELYKAHKSTEKVLPFIDENIPAEYDDCLVIEIPLPNLASLKLSTDAEDNSTPANEIAMRRFNSSGPSGTTHDPLQKINTMAYYNFKSEKWEHTVDSYTTFSPDGSAGGLPWTGTGDIGFSPMSGLVFPKSDGDVQYYSNLYGKPMTDFGFPMHRRFETADGQTIDLSKYIDEAVILEGWEIYNKVVPRVGYSHNISTGAAVNTEDGYGAVYSGTFTVGSGKTPLYYGATGEACVFWDPEVGETIPFYEKEVTVGSNKYRYDNTIPVSTFTSSSVTNLDGSITTTVTEGQPTLASKGLVTKGVTAFLLKESEFFDKTAQKQKWLRSQPRFIAGNANDNYDSGYIYDRSSGFSGAVVDISTIPESDLVTRNENLGLRLMFPPLSIDFYEPKTITSSPAGRYKEGSSRELIGYLQHLYHNDPNPTAIRNSWQRVEGSSLHGINPSYKNQKNIIGLLDKENQTYVDGLLRANTQHYPLHVSGSVKIQTPYAGSFPISNFKITGNATTALGVYKHASNVALIDLYHSYAVIPSSEGSTYSELIQHDSIPNIQGRGKSKLLFLPEAIYPSGAPQNSADTWKTGALSQFNVSLPEKEEADVILRPSDKLVLGIQDSISTTFASQQIQHNASGKEFVRWGRNYLEIPASTDGYLRLYIKRTRKDNKFNIISDESRYNQNVNRDLGDHFVDDDWIVHSPLMYSGSMADDIVGPSYSVPPSMKQVVAQDEFKEEKALKHDKISIAQAMAIDLLKGSDTNLSAGYTTLGKTGNDPIVGTSLLSSNTGFYVSGAYTLNWNAFSKKSFNDVHTGDKEYQTSLTATLSGTRVVTLAAGGIDIRVGMGVSTSSGSPAIGSGAVVVSVDASDPKIFTVDKDHVGTVPNSTTKLDLAARYVMPTVPILRGNIAPTNATLGADGGEMGDKVGDSFLFTLLSVIVHPQNLGWDCRSSGTYPAGVPWGDDGPGNRFGSGCLSVIEELNDSETVGTFFKTNQKTGLSTTTNLAAGSKDVTIGSTTGLVVGQSLVNTGGAGALGVGAKIASIVNGTQFKTTVGHATLGAATFTAEELPWSDYTYVDAGGTSRTRNFHRSELIGANNNAASAWHSNVTFPIFKKTEGFEPAVSTLKVEFRLVRIGAFKVITGDNGHGSTYNATIANGGQWNGSDGRLSPEAAGTLTDKFPSVSNTSSNAVELDKGDAFYFRSDRARKMLTYSQAITTTDELKESILENPAYTWETDKPNGEGPIIYIVVSKGYLQAGLDTLYYGFQKERNTVGGTMTFSEVYTKIADVLNALAHMNGFAYTAKSNVNGNYLELSYPEDPKLRQILTQYKSDIDTSSTFKLNGIDVLAAGSSAAIKKEVVYVARNVDMNNDGTVDVDTHKYWEANPYAPNPSGTSPSDVAWAFKWWKDDTNGSQTSYGSSGITRDNLILEAGDGDGSIAEQTAANDSIAVISAPFDANRKYLEGYIPSWRTNGGTDGSATWLYEKARTGSTIPENRSFAVSYTALPASQLTIDITDEIRSPAGVRNKIDRKRIRRTTSKNASAFGSLSKYTSILGGNVYSDSMIPALTIYKNESINLKDVGIPRGWLLETTAGKISSITTKTVQFDLKDKDDDNGGSAIALTDANFVNPYADSSDAIFPFGFTTAAVNSGVTTTDAGASYQLATDDLSGGTWATANLGAMPGGTFNVTNYIQKEFSLNFDYSKLTALQLISGFGNSPSSRNNIRMSEYEYSAYYTKEDKDSIPIKGNKNICLEMIVDPPRGSRFGLYNITLMQPSYKFSRTHFGYMRDMFEQSVDSKFVNHGTNETVYGSPVIVSAVNSTNPEIPKLMSHTSRYNKTSNAVVTKPYIENNYESTPQSTNLNSESLRVDVAGSIRTRGITPPGNIAANIRTRG